MTLPQLKKVNCLVLIAASAVQAFGIYNIHALSGVTEGGIFGATLLLEHWFQLSPALTSLLMNGACYFLGWKTIGKSFLAYSVIASLSYSGAYWICEQFPPLWPEIAFHPLLASIIGALFIGIGAGLCVRAGGATCGDDALAMSIRQLTGIPVEKIYLASDLTILLLSLSYIPLRRIVYSLLTVVLSGQIIGLLQPKRKEE